jgi:16S rRNA processing protein RimM
LAIRKIQLEPADEDEFYWADLIGLSVENLDGEVLGTVDYLLETGANDVLVVKADKQDERLIPFVMEDIVKLVDLDNKLIRVDWAKDY